MYSVACRAGEYLTSFLLVHSASFAEKFMRMQSKRLSILSQPEAQEVYSVPAFNALDLILAVKP